MCAVLDWFTQWPTASYNFNESSPRVHLENGSAGLHFEKTLDNVVYADEVGRVDVVLDKAWLGYNDKGETEEESKEPFVGEGAELCKEAID